MNSNQKTKSLISLILTLIAVGLHTYLAYKFYGLKYGALNETSACNINLTFNCDAVSASQFAVFLGIPIALWGAATNLIFLFLQLVAILGWSEDSRKTQVQTFGLSIFIALASVVMGSISLLFLRQYCLFCIAAYVLSFACAFLWWQATYPKKPGEVTDSLRAVFSTTRWVLGSIIAIPALAFLLNTIFIDRHNGREIETMVVNKYNAWTTAPPQNFTEDGLVFDSSPSTPKKMVIVEFADFLCPHCKVAAETIHPFAAANPDVKFIFKNFPLDGTCNPDPSFGGRGDGVRCRMAQAPYCGEKLHKKGWAVHDAIFGKQEKLQSIGSKDNFDKFICEELGFDCTEFKACLDSPETQNAVRNIAQEGVNAKIQGTPSIFVNGRQLGNGQYLPVLRQVHQQLQK